MAGYADDAVLSMCCQSCAASLFGAVARSPTVLVPLPGATAATSPPADDTPRPARQPRPRVRRVPLYEPLTLGLRRRSRRDS